MHKRPQTPDQPAPGQESVWDYPRPPRVERSTERIRMTLGGSVIADSIDTCRVLETSHPPVYYVPRKDFRDGVLSAASGNSFCEFKGVASYVTLVGGSSKTAQAAGWFYAEPAPGFSLLRDLVAVYPSAMDSCTVDGEVVQAQEGDFYGGWITSRVVGPFKGAPGTMGW